jgi:hypothetical protein
LRTRVHERILHPLPKESPGVPRSSD